MTHVLSWLSANSHWLVPLALVLVASLVTRLTPIPQARGVLPALQVLGDLLSVLQHRNAAGVLQLPLVQVSQPPPGLPIAPPRVTAPVVSVPLTTTVRVADAEAALEADRAVVASIVRPPPPLLALILAASLLASGCATTTAGGVDPLARWRDRIAQQVDTYQACALPVLVDALGDTVAHAAEEVISTGAAWLVARLLVSGAADPIGWGAVGADLVVWIGRHWRDEWRPEIATCIAARAAVVASDLSLDGQSERVRTAADSTSPLVGAQWLREHVQTWYPRPSK